MYHSVDVARSGDLADEDLVSAFESLRLDPGLFGHADHVRLAFVYLRTFGLLETLGRYPEGLRRLAALHGAPNRYHETVTWAMVILVHERMAQARESIDWPSFARANPDLMRWRDGAFFDYYGPEILESEIARRTFVLPR